MSTETASPSPLSLFRQVGILGQAQWRMLTHQLEGNLRGSKLMAFTMGAFMVGYLVIGYVLFSKGLGYVFKLPAVGNLMAERVLYMMIFFFFVMLVFSNAIISYTSLFRGRETSWLLTLPIDHRALFCWRVIETLFISSWGLIFLSAPLLASYGQIYQVPTSFYFKSFFLYLPFVVIPAAMSSWLLIFVLRFANRYWKYVVIAAVVIMGARYLYNLNQTVEEATQASESIIITFNRVLKHTEVSVNPFVPSTWMSEVILQLAKDYGGGTAGFYTLLLVSYALMAALITTLFSRGYYNAWNRSNRRRASAAWARRLRLLAREENREPLGRRLLKLLPIKSSTRALLGKDTLCFIRDPAQWVQCAIVFGLLFLYVFNLRNMGYDYENPFWASVISYLNFGVCCLALSTLATRFIFPQFSLEGGRLWILGLAPFGLDKVVWLKFVHSVVVIVTLTCSLMLVSGLMLELAWSRIAYFMAAICFMSIGLNALSVGLGTLFPNFHEQNPAKIVSGFGGTLCLILNFVYIILSIAALVYPVTLKFGKTPQPPEVYQTAEIISFIIVILLTIICGILPLILALRRAKRLELLGNL